MTLRCKKKARSLKGARFSYLNESILSKSARFARLFYMNMLLNPKKQAFGGF